MIKSLLVINLKALFSGMFQASRGKKKMSKGKVALFTILFAYVIVVFVFMFGTMFNQLCEPLFTAGIGWLYFAVIAILAFALCVITSIFAVQSQIFNARDNELLLSMPVKPTSIVLSRILSLLIYEYLFDVMIAIPAIFVWWRSGYATVGGTVLLLLGFALLPLLALAVACIVGWLVALLTSRMRNKNIITLILSLGFLAVYFWLYTNMQSYLTQLITSGAEIAEAIRKAAFPAYHFGVAAANGNIVSFLLFALCAIVPFAITCAILIRSFLKIATTKRGAAKIEYKARELHASGARTALLKIELRRFFSNPMIILNAGIGAVFMIALGVVLFIKPSLILSVTEPLTAMIGIEPAVLGSAVVMLLCSMITISSASVSLEGKTLWLAKSLPIGSGDVLLAKALSHMLISGVPALFASIACVIRLGGDPLSALAVVLGPVSISVAMGFFGVIINLMFPKLDWINEIQPVKQGMSVIISMFGAMALVIVLVIIYILALSSVMSVTVYLLACSALLLVLSGVMYLYLMRGGSRRFAALA